MCIASASKLYDVVSITEMFKRKRNYCEMILHTHGQAVKDVTRKTDQSESKASQARQG